MATNFNERLKLWRKAKDAGSLESYLKDAVERSLDQIPRYKQGGLFNELDFDRPEDTLKIAVLLSMATTHAHHVVDLAKDASSNQEDPPQSVKDLIEKWGSLKKGRRVTIEKHNALKKRADVAVLHALDTGCLGLWDEGDKRGKGDLFLYESNGGLFQFNLPESAKGVLQKSKLKTGEIHVQDLVDLGKYKNIESLEQLLKRTVPIKPADSVRDKSKWSERALQTKFQTLDEYIEHMSCLELES